MKTASREPGAPEGRRRTAPAVLLQSKAFGAFMAALLAIAFGLVLLRGDPLRFWNDDYAISILPVFADIARSWREGVWPLLSPSCWACANLAGEYQYGTFSLFINAAVVAIWQWPLSFPNQAAALSIVHLAVLAAGAFLLARRRRLPAGIATAVALIAALNGWMIGWGATDWFGALAAEAWLPWCWWAFEEAMRPSREGGWRARLRLLLPAPFVYLLLAGGFPYTVVMLGVVSAWLAARALARRRPWALLPLVAGWALGLGLAAPSWLSLVAYMAGSNRSQGAGAGNFAWAVPFSALPGMILPDWTSSWQGFFNTPTTHAALELAGAFVPAVALVAALACRRRSLLRVARWDLALAAAVLLLCMLPSPGVFRWSFRWLPLFHLALALAGGKALLLMAAARRRAGTPAFRAMIIRNPGAWAVAAVGATWLAMTPARAANADAVTHPLPLLTLLIAVAWMVLDHFASRRGGWKTWVPPGIVVLSLLATYRYMYTNPGVPIYAFGPSLARVAPLAPDRLYISFYREPHQAYGARQTPPDFGAILRPGSTAMFAGAHLVNGYSPIMAQGVGRRLRMETHGSIPDDVAADLLGHEAGADGLLARLGVDGIIIAREKAADLQTPPPEEWETAFANAEGTIYHRRGGPRPEVAAWVAPAPGEPPSHAPAHIARVTNTRMVAGADVSVPGGGLPGLVAFRRPYFPGYEAALDGVPVAVGSYQGLLPVVELPPGSHGRLTLRYRPAPVWRGLALAGLSVAAMVGFAVFGWPGRRRTGRGG